MRKHEVSRVDFSLPKINGGLKSTLQNYNSNKNTVKTMEKLLTYIVKILTMKLCKKKLG